MHAHAANTPITHSDNCSTSPFHGLRLAAWAALAVLGGCAATQSEPEVNATLALAAQRGLPAETVESVRGQAPPTVAALATAPLTAAGAARLALLRNPELKARIAELGFAEAAVLEAGRIRNPVLSGAVLNGGPQQQVTLGLVVSLADLLTMPTRKRLAAAELEAAKQSAAAAMLEGAADAEAAFHRYVAAQQNAALQAQIAKAASLSAQLAERFHQAGNLTAKDLALERAAAAQAQLEELEAKGEASRARVELGLAMGLSAGDAWQAPRQLPAPLEEEDALDDLLALAQDSRLDLAAAKARAAVAAERNGYRRWRRWIEGLEIGVERERGADGERLAGPTLSSEVPLSRQRHVLVRGEAELRIATAQAERLALAVEAGVRAAHAAVLNSAARAREFRERLIPARIKATAEAQAEQRYMLIGVFETLAEKRLEYEAYRDYLAAVRDYWLARTELKRNVGNALPSGAAGDGERIDVESYIKAPAPPNERSHHGN